MSLNVGELFASLGLDTTNFDKGLSKSGGGLSKLLDIGKKVAVVASGAVTAIGGAALVTGFKRLSSIEDATASITTQLGSAKKAAELMNQVLAVAKGTPFSLDQFASASRTLVAMSVPAKKIPGYLNAIGEAAAASGQGAAGLDQVATTFGKMSAAGQLSLDDVWSLSSAGVPALAILANSFGETTSDMKKLISTGAVPAGKAMDVLTKGILEGSKGGAGATTKLAGTMKALGKTTSGSLANAKASLARFGATILKPAFSRAPALFGAISGKLDELGKIVGPAIAAFADSPQVAAFFDGIGKAVSGLGSNKGVKAFIATLGDLGKNLIKIGQALLPPLITLVGKVAPAAFAAAYGAVRGLNGVFGFLARHMDVIVPIVTALLAGFVTYKVVTGAITVATKLFAAAQAVLNAVMSLNPIGLVVAAIVALAVGLYLAYKKIKPFHEAVDKVGRILRDTVWPAVKKVAKVVGKDLVKAWDAVKGPLKTALKVITQLGRGMVTYMVEPIKTAVAVIVKLFHGDFAGAFDLITALPGKLLAGFGDLPTKLGDLLGKVPGLLLEALKGLGTILVSAGKSALSGLVKGIFEGLPWLYGFVIALPILLVDWLGDAALWLLKKGASANTGLIKGIWDALPGLVTFLGTLPGKVFDALKTMYSKIRQVGINVIHGMWNGIWGSITWLKDNVTSLPGKVYGALSGMYGKMRQVGINIIHGMWNGVWGSLDWLKEKIGGIGGSVVKGFKSALKINSPSKVMIPIGTSVSEGLALGMTNAKRLVTNAAGTLSSAAVPIISAPLVPQVAGAGASGGMDGLAGNQVGGVTGVHIQNARFDSELDIDQVMRRAEFAVAAGRL